MLCRAAVALYFIIAQALWFTLANGSHKIDSVTLIYAEGTGGSVANNTAKYTSWTHSSTNTALFTYSSGVWTCVTAGNYHIDLTMNIAGTSAGTTASNEFYLVELNTPGQTTYGTAPAVRSSAWRVPLSATRYFNVGDTISVTFDVSTALSFPVSINYCAISISKTL